MNQFHFSINLNKYGEKRYQIIAEQRLFRNMILSFLIITVLLFGTVLYFNNLLESKLDNRRELLNSIRREIETYREVGEYLSSSDLERLARASTDRIFWANKLIALADIITEKIAITHFTYRQGVFSLFGITQVDVDEKEFDLVDEFIDSLRENPQINEDFDDIRFIRASRDTERDVAIIRFQIDLVGRRLPTAIRRRR